MLIERCLCGETNGHVEAHGEVLAIRCACGVARLQSHETRESYERQYGDGSYHDAADRHANCIPYAQRFEHDLTVAAMRFKRYRSLLNGQLPEHARALDVGCANGAFAEYLVSCDFDAVGLDPHPTHESPRLYAGTLANAPAAIRDTRYGLITFHDVLEHVLDPLEQLMHAAALLDVPGTLIVDVPDVSDPHGQHHWKAEHVWYFTCDALLTLMHQAALKVITIDYPIPGKLVVYAGRA